MPPVIELAQPVSKKLKICLYGPSGSGKTLAALTFPNVLLVDAESGSDLYAGRPGVPQFHRARCKTVSDLEYVVREVEKDNGATYKTLVIDPISVFYDVEKNVQSGNNSKDIGFREWAKINNRMSSLYNRLTSLPAHVILVAREAIEYAGEGQNLRKVGHKPEADKKLVYMMDFVVYMQADHTGVAEKSRGVILGKGGQLSAVNWDVFAPVADLYTTGQQQEYEDDEQAADREADSFENKDVAISFFQHWRGQGLTDGDILKALDVKSSIREYAKGRKSADEQVKAWLNQQLAAKTSAV